MEGITYTPNRFIRGFAKEIGILFRSFYEALLSSRVYNYASLKMLISRLHFNIIELEIRDALGGEQLFT